MRLSSARLGSFRLPRGCGDLIENVAQRDEPPGGHIVEALSDAFPGEYGAVTQDAHNGDEEVAVVAVLAQELECSLHRGKRQDINPHRIRADARFEDTGLDPGPDGWLRDPEHLRDFGHLSPQVPVGDVVAYSLEGAPTLRIILVRRELL